MTNGILIIGYGTRNGNLEEILNKQADRLKCRGWPHVGIAFFRVSEPTIPDALRKLVGEGADNIVCIPYYIAEGTLTKELIPEKLGLGSRDMGEIEIENKKVSISVATAFNGTPILTDILCDKIADVGGDRDCGILVLGHGTRYKALTNEKVIKLNAERLRSRGFIHTVHAFNEFCEPSIKDSLNQLEKQGVERIIAIPLFIAMGIHLGEEIPEQMGIPPYSEGGEITVNGRRIPVTYTRPVEADNRLTDLIEKKAKEYSI